MLNLMGKMIRFRLGQKVTRGVAKKIGFGPFASVLGLVGGIRSMRRG